MKAAGAGRDFIKLARLQLVHVFGVYGQGTIHQQEVHLAISQGALEKVGRMGRIHVGDGSYGDAHSVLDLPRNVEGHAAARVRSVQAPLPMAAEIELCAEAGGAVDTIAGEIQIGSELAHVHVQRSEAQMQAVGAGLLEQLGELDILFQGGKQGILPERSVIFLEHVDQYLYGEIFAAGLLDLLNQLGDEPGAVLEGLRAVFVIALVAHAG